MFVVFDMDGTLSNPSHRVHFLGDKDWDSFYEACDRDEPKSEIIELFKMHLEKGHRVEIWTGRRESTRLKTFDWLTKHTSVEHMLNLGEIRMRSNGDRRHDTVTKGEWFDQFGKPDVVYEDRNSMVEFYRSNDVTCLQVAKGDF